MAAINDLIAQISDPVLRGQIQREVDKLNKQKKFGLVFEEHLPERALLWEMPVKKGSLVTLKNGKPTEIYLVKNIHNGNAECVSKSETRNRKSEADGDNNTDPDFLSFGKAVQNADNNLPPQTVTFQVDDLVCVADFGDSIYPYLKPIDFVCNAPESGLWHTLIEADNYHALQLLEYLYAGKVDCIYIDPPYNTGAKDWKYNNDYVDSSDAYRHSKWLSFMEKRLKLAKCLLKPNESVLIVTIDEKEYLHLGCLLEELFPDANIQMVTDVINPRGTNRENEFSRVEEYIFFCRFGNASIIKTENNMLGNTDETGKSRVWYAFNRGNNPRSGANGQFFPIYINEEQKKIISVGESMDINHKPSDFPKIPGLTSVFPINDRGGESIWRAIPETTREWVKKGYVKVSKYDKKKDRWTLSYIPSGMQKRIESGEIIANKKLSDGSIDIKHIDNSSEKVSPRSVWFQQQHNATDYGASIIKRILLDHTFSYPKSLYAVKDTIRFFVEDKPDALIVDFFAGSGTTLHAVNLLNAEDGGQRRCIMVTNNEVSESEAKSLTAQGFHPGDEEWEKLGIARYVTWLRTVCSIQGHDVNGNPLKGNYLGSDLPMADGFKANAAFFKLGFLDKNAVALGRQFRELLPLLWMKAGAVGPCPQLTEETIPESLIFAKNRFAVLTDEAYFSEFELILRNTTEIETVYLITDYEGSFRSMAATLPGRTCYQLYRDYLDNFRINTGRSAR